MRIAIVFCFVFSIIFSEVIQAEEINKNEPNIISEAALLLDSNTGAVLFEKNGYTKMYPASLTKIATGIFAIEKGNLSDIVTVSEAAYSTIGTKVYLEKGEQVPLKTLVEGMLINSGNDAAVAIAEYLGGTIEGFSEKLNNYLQSEIGVKNTQFVNPSGLFDENHFTTAYDLAIITKYALKNDVFKEIFGTKELKWDGLTWDTTLVSHHQMVNGERPYEGVIGGKTGFVNESKQTLATAVEKDDMGLIAIVMKGNFKRDIYKDTANLFDFGFLTFAHEFIYADEKFTVDGKSFQLNSNRMITVPKEQGSKEITSSGELHINNGQGEIIQTIQLIEIIPPKKELDKEFSATPIQEESKSGFSIWIFTLFILGSCIIYLLKKRMKKEYR